MRIRKVLVAAMTACLATGALAGCGSKKLDEGVIKIGIPESTTGEDRGGSYQEILGIRYARKMHPTVNIGGEECTVKLVGIDDKLDEIETVNAAQKLVSEKVSVVSGSYGSDVSVIAGQIFVDAKIPVIDCSYINPQVAKGNDFYFRVCLIDPSQGTIMANYAYQSGAKNAAVIAQLGDDYSSGLGPCFRDAFAKLGDSIVSEEQPQASQTDFKAIPTNIRTADSDIIFVPSSITTAPLIVRQAKELGITTTIAIGDTWENSTIIENAGADSGGVVLFIFFGGAEPVNDETVVFIKGFKEYLVKEKQEGIIPAVSALGYDSYLATIKAIEDIGFTDTVAIHDVLKNVEIDGVTENIIFSETGDANKDIAFIKTIKDGKFQFLTTTTVE